MGRAQQQLGQAAKVIFQRLFVEGDARQAQKIVFEVVQIPGDGLAVKAGARITDFVVQVAASLHLEARQHRQHFAV